MSRRFEFVGGTSAKYWEVHQGGAQVTVRYGRLGMDGQQQTKTLPSADAANRHVEKLVSQKLAKGYVECAAA